MEVPIWDHVNPSKLSSIVYSITGIPPVVGAVHDNDTDELPGIAIRSVGAPI